MTISFTETARLSLCYYTAFRLYLSLFGYVPVCIHHFQITPDVFIHMLLKRFDILCLLNQIYTIHVFVIYTSYNNIIATLYNKSKVFFFIFLQILNKVKNS